MQHTVWRHRGDVSWSSDDWRNGNGSRRSTGKGSRRPTSLASWRAHVNADGQSRWHCDPPHWGGSTGGGCFSFRPSGGGVCIRKGTEVWREFCDATRLRYYRDGLCVLIDLHHVIDTMDHEESISLGVTLDHIEKATTILCSFGHAHRRKAFDITAEFYPIINECDGYIFTDYRQGYYESVDVYREPWMAKNCVGVRGDKGQVAKLIGLPVLLFDDNEDNIDLVRARTAPTCRLDGVLVRRGRNAWKTTNPGYYEVRYIGDFVHCVRSFETGAVPPAIGSMNPYGGEGPVKHGSCEDSGGGSTGGGCFSFRPSAAGLPAASQALQRPAMSETEAKKAKKRKTGDLGQHRLVLMETRAKKATKAKEETKAAGPTKAKEETQTAVPHGLTVSAEALARASDAMSDAYYIYFWECVQRRWAERRLEDPSLPEQPPSWWVWKRADGMALRRDPYEGFL